MAGLLRENGGPWTTRQVVLASQLEVAMVSELTWEAHVTRPGYIASSKEWAEWRTRALLTRRVMAQLMGKPIERS